jgi:preprotein translocase subunit SecG
MGVAFLSRDRRMVIFITIVHVIVCLFLAIVVLLQSGKAADLAGAFGGMGSQTVFGPRGSATVLSKATTIAAALFMVTSLTLSILSTRAGKASPAIFQKVVPVTQQKGGAPSGGTIPMTVTPEVGGKAGAPQTIHVPVNQTPPPQKQKK